MSDELSPPTRIFNLAAPYLTMGVGARHELPRIVSGLGKRVLIVTDPGLDGLPMLDEIVEAVRSECDEVAIYNKILPDPPIEVIEDCVAAARGVKAEVVLAIGGGSTLDTAKVASVMYKLDCGIHPLFGIGKVPERGVPTVLVPTTSGTGSEMSPIAVISDEADQLKKGVVSDHIVATNAVVDPELTLSLPPAPTAYTGMDALTHCIEGFTNRHAVPLMDGYALEGIRAISRTIRTAVNEGSNLDARYEMSRGALLGGICLGPVNTGAAHALAYPLGARFHVPHGVANSLLLPHVMRFNAPVVQSRYGAIAEAMGVEDAVKGVEELSADVGTNKRMRDYGVEEKHLPEMAAAAMLVTRLLNINPRKVTEANALAIYEQAW